MAGTTELKRLEGLRRWMVTNRVMSLTSKDVTIIVHESSLFPSEVNEPDKFGSPTDDYADETPHERIRRLHAAKLQREANGDAHE